MADATLPATAALPLNETRGYQREMLEESFKRNIIIALDTGSGKTRIAILRIKAEVECQPVKVCWFLAPTITLCEQQKTVITQAIPGGVAFISGASNPDDWKGRVLWEGLLATHKVVVSTPQVLLNALRHGYVSMGKDISLIVFDEAHHAVREEPYNQIMREFYFHLPPRVSGNGPCTIARPAIMGMTASPVYGGNVERAFRSLEANLDCTIRAPRIHRAELGRHVYRPTFTHVMYEPSSDLDSFSTNLASLDYVVKSLKIDDDPLVILLRKQLSTMPQDAVERYRLDQRLSKVIAKKDTFCEKGLRDLRRAAQAICLDVGTWAADWYISEVLTKFISFQSGQYTQFFSNWRDTEAAYMAKQLTKVQATEVSYDPDDIVDDVTSKTQTLIALLLREKAEAEAEVKNNAHSCIVFVQRRDIVYALATVLRHHPKTKDKFRIGCLVGSSDNSQRYSFLDITRTFVQQTQDKTLKDFESGNINLLISTSVAEEGVDVQACGSVIRWDPPPNMASWAQSRGRARRKRSTFTLMFSSDSAHQKSVEEWEKMEQQMIALYNSERERQAQVRRLQEGCNEGSEDDDDDNDNDDKMLRIESTGAVLTPHSAIGHLEYFCAVMPDSDHANLQPLYDIDPPDMPEGWHAFEHRLAVEPPKGPFGATVTLPKLLAPELRVFKVPRIYKKRSLAQRHVAFKAYKALYHAGMLNEHLLPLMGVVEPHLEDELKAMLKDIEKRASTASVSAQMDPWAPRKSSDGTFPEGGGWWSSRLVVDGLTPLLLFTRRRLPAWENDGGPILYRPGRLPVQAIWTTLNNLPTKAMIDEARSFTRRLFWGIHGSRMQYDDLDFRYLFLPTDDKRDDLWSARRAWLLEQDLLNDVAHEYHFLADAGTFGEAFKYPDDVTLLRTGYGFHKVRRFVRWKYDPMNDEEKTQFLETYACDAPKITYPLLVARRLPARTNFLLPTPITQPRLDPTELLLSTDQCSVVLCSASEVEYSMLLPSILREIGIFTTVESLRDTLFRSPTLHSIPLNLLAVAATAPAAQERFNYQRLEMLGDTVLKFITTIQLLHRYPLWHEGYLSKRKDHIVSNVQLAKSALGKQLYTWIIRNTMLGKKWKPEYFSSSTPASTPSQQVAPPAPTSNLPKEGTEKKLQSLHVRVEFNATYEKKTKKNKRQADSQELSTKVLADVVESLIGAAYIHGGFELGLECIRVFGLGMEWEPLPKCISSLFSRVAGNDENMTAVLSNVEKMLGYTFNRKLLLVEALSHASHQENKYTVSYERLEFLGDSVLDMIVTHHLYHAPGKLYSPGHVHLRRSALVNAHMLAYLCLKTHIDLITAVPKCKGQGLVELEHGTQRVYMWQCLAHSSPRLLDDQAQTFARYQKMQNELEAAFLEGTIFPWAALLHLQAPKCFSDMVESLIGAVFLDSSGNLDVVRQILRKLGYLDILERVVDDGVDVLHPVSRVSLWASNIGKKVQYRLEKGRGEVKCTIVLDEEDTISMSTVDNGHASAEEVKFTVAENLIKTMGLRNVGTKL
ncbi:P-loop containing nucleoside triphosphate hydrolase protein [Pleurotus eryngii]|uniref:P-loop containing nucleoside triphosphate hydrolase protein n=1 Tax=Pleurotus eryngii TaxID=5323 RepID=A0A9P6A8Y9_PLEER|nr:P-loop containing nucleoside triphosphate hydrolase protein [Pleurotus eryngii]